MTSVEIEDVLSSIRRLVTDDLRPKPVPVDNKLILTPALRVVPEAAPEQAAVADTLDVDLDADLAAALTEEQGTDVPVEDAPSENAQSSEAYPMFLHHDRRVDLAPSSEGAEVADTVMTIGAAIPADGYEAELGDVMPVPEWPESSWVAPDVIEGVEEAEVIPLPDPAHDAVPDWAEVEVGPEDPMPLADDAADHMAEAAMAALAAEEAAEAAGGITELDEDMLREIVRDIIREELQGTLGEKITRNVRKLVRAEINRALITDDLD